MSSGKNTLIGNNTEKKGPTTLAKRNKNISLVETGNIEIEKKDGHPFKFRIDNTEINFLSTSPEIMLTGINDEAQILRMKRIARLPWFVENEVKNAKEIWDLIYSVEGNKGFTHSFIVSLANFLTGYGIKPESIIIVPSEMSLSINGEFKKIPAYTATVGVTDFVTGNIQSKSVTEPIFGVKKNKHTGEEELFKKTHPDRIAQSKAERNAYNAIIPKDIQQAAMALIEYLNKLNK